MQPQSQSFKRPRSGVAVSTVHGNPRLQPLKSAVRQHSQAGLCKCEHGKIKIGKGVTLRNHIACHVECALASRSLRFLFDSQPCRYSHTVFEGHTSSDVDHSHNYQRDNCICLQRSRDKQGGSHEKSHQECYIRGEKINATESVKPDSYLPKQPSLSHHANSNNTHYIVKD